MVVLDTEDCASDGASRPTSPFSPMSSGSFARPHRRSSMRPHPLELVQVASDMPNPLPGLRWISSQAGRKSRASRLVDWPPEPVSPTIGSSLAADAAAAAGIVLPVSPSGRAQSCGWGSEGGFDFNSAGGPGSAGGGSSSVLDRLDTTPTCSTPPGVKCSALREAWAASTLDRSHRLEKGVANHFKAASPRHKSSAQKLSQGLSHSSSCPLILASRLGEAPTSVGHWEPQGGNLPVADWGLTGVRGPDWHESMLLGASLKNGPRNSVELNNVPKISFHGGFRELRRSSSISLLSPKPEKPEPLSPSWSASGGASIHSGCQSQNLRRVSSPGIGSLGGISEAQKIAQHGWLPDGFEALPVHVLKNPRMTGHSR